MTEQVDWKTLDGRARGKLLRDAVFRAYENEQKLRRSQRIGAGKIGKECAREIWYMFRWADSIEVIDGRTLRLFETGNQQEGRLIQDLRRVGAAVLDRNPHDNRQQISVSSHNGHHFGFLDAVGQNIPFALYAWDAVECKTHNDKSFNKLEKEGVERSKPEHYAQLMTYLREQKLSEGLYAAVNKNNDDLYFEFVPFDPRYAERLAHKAGVIIHTQQAPPKIHNAPTFFGCRFCSAKEVCHKGAKPQRNCRTCIHVETADEGRWKCALLDKMLTIEEQYAGCKKHLYLPALIGNGEQVDADDASVTYKMATGEYWVDRGPETA